MNEFVIKQVASKEYAEEVPDENIVNDAPAHVPTKNGGQPHGQNGNIKSHAHGTTLKTMVPEMSEEDVNRGKGLKLIDWLTSIYFA